MAWRLLPVTEHNACVMCLVFGMRNILLQEIEWLKNHLKPRSFQSSFYCYIPVWSKMQNALSASPMNNKNHFSPAHLYRPTIELTDYILHAQTTGVTIICNVVTSSVDGQLWTFPKHLQLTALNIAIQQLISVSAVTTRTWTFLTMSYILPTVLHPIT